MPRASLSARMAMTPTSRSKPKNSWTASASARAPAGLCAASTSTVGLRRTTSSRPGEVTPAKPASTRSMSSGWPPPPEEPLDRGQRAGGVAGLMRAVERQEDVLVVAAEAAQVDQLATDGDLATQHAELQALPGDGGLDLGRALEQHLGDVDVLLGQDREGAGLDDAGLLGGDLDLGRAEEALMVEADRGDDGDLTVGDVGRVPLTAQPDLDDGHVDRGVGEGGVGHRDQDLEVAQGRLPRLGRALVDDGEIGGDLLVGGDEPVGIDRLAVEGDPLADVVQVGAGESPCAQTELAQQPLGHPGGRGLAVGAGHVDDGEGPLRVVHEVDDRADPLQGRSEVVLRGPGQDLGLDLAHPGKVRGSHGVRLSGPLRAAPDPRRSGIRSPPTRRAEVPEAGPRGSGRGLRPAQLARAWCRIER